ncbi:MAG: OmpA family protein [Thermoanaerobaculia bacterium]
MRNSVQLGRLSSALAIGATFVAALGFATAARAEGTGRIEGFAGYYVAEELDDNVSYGVRGGWMPSHGWGLMLAYERFEKNNGKGYGRNGNVDGQIDSLEASYVAYPKGENFEIFTGLGVTDLNVDAHVASPDVDLKKSTLSVHVGLGYRAMLGDNLYLRPEVRARVYDAGDNTIDVIASIALGWSWDNE